MTALRTYQDDEYWPEFGTLTVRDAGSAYEEGGPFGQHDSKVQPCGTIARTGNGWLEGAAGDCAHVVRMELHDVAPPADVDEWADDWADVLEIPYRSRSGRVGLGYVTGGFSGEEFALAGPGPYRVRVSRRPITDDDDLDDLWLLRFWPAEPTPPRWFRRHEPAVRPGDPGWHGLFGHQVADLLWAVSAARDETGGTTLDAVRQWGAEHGRDTDWLTQPLTGHDDVAPSAVATQLSVPVPAALVDMLGLFVAAGVLVDENGRYREPAVVPKVEDVVDLPPEHRARLVVRRDHDRFCSFAADLVSVALWDGSTQTLGALSERTLAPEADVHATLGWAERGGLLTIAGPLDGTFDMTL